MIAYLDTSVVVGLLIQEPSSDACRRLWDSADAVASSPLLVVEAGAALARAARMGRIDPHEHARALDTLDLIWSQVESVQVDDSLVTIAAALARTHALRGYDAVQCASAVMLNDRELVAAAGDRRLLEAWASLGIATYDLAA